VQDVYNPGRIASDFLTMKFQVSTPVT